MLAVIKRTADLGENGIAEWKRTGFMIHKDSQGNCKGRIKYGFFEDSKNNMAYDTAEKILIPTLIIHGDNDKIVPLDQSIRLSGIIPKSRLEILKGCSHFYERPDDSRKMIRLSVDFLSKTLFGKVI